jgi:hypothetical protein
MLVGIGPHHGGNRKMVQAIRVIRDVVGREGYVVIHAGDVVVVDEADIVVNAWDANGPCGRAAWVDVIDGALDYRVAVDVDDFVVLPSPIGGVTEVIPF